MPPIGGIIGHHRARTKGSKDPLRVAGDNINDRVIRSGVSDGGVGF
jgi:hypothetical protein